MKRFQILIVDDSKPMLKLLEVVLKKRFDVFAASSAFSALTWLKQGNLPDIIISDIQMPDVDGVEFISQLSNSTYYYHIPVLILSGYDEEEILNMSKDVNVEGYITKPFSPADLIDKINAILRTNGYSKNKFMCS